MLFSFFSYSGLQSSIVDGMCPDLNLSVEMDFKRPNV